jgi:hypothetical protein
VINIPQVIDAGEAVPCVLVVEAANFRITTCVPRRLDQCHRL